MGKDTEDVIVLEDNEDQSIHKLSDDLERKEEEKEIKEEEKEEVELEAKTKKTLIIVAGASLFIFLITLLLLFLPKEEESPPMQIEPKAVDITKKLQQKEAEHRFTPSKLEKLIKKANILYEKGNKKDALKVYKQIASFNESISHYNIGVAQMKEQNFKEAIDSFQQAIQNKEHKCVSAINAAVCSLKLKNEKLFKYYIDLSFAYLPKESSSPLYSYYAALINYYKEFYVESLSSLYHQTSTYYKSEQNIIASKIFNLLDNDLLAIKHLEQKSIFPNDLSLGLLYSRIGEYDISIKHLVKASQRGIDPLKTQIALSMAYMKKGFFGSASEIMEKVYSEYKEKAIKVYPLKAALQESLFDVNYAQQEFTKDIYFDTEKIYSLVFYFSPYKVFNAKQTIAYIRKGGVNVFIDETTSALDYLKRSSTISKVNLSISKGIENTLNFKIHEANKIFRSTIEDYPNHSILHYNLGLSYAQIGNYSAATKHFKKSYHLDRKNYISGIFAAMCTELTHKDNTKLMENIKSDLEKDKNINQKDFYIALLNLLNNNMMFLSEWMEKDKENRPAYRILDAIAAKKTNNFTKYQESTLHLKNAIPEDIVANMIYLNAKNSEKDIKEYARDIQKYFHSSEFEYKSLFYGPKLVKELYIKTLQIGGLLYRARDMLKKQLENEKEDTIGIMHSLAYVDIFTKNFEEAYTIYNQLIDEHGQDDSSTIFLAAVASIAANHPENAIALLELAKLTDPANFESRYALGLLYQEVKNMEAAMMQYTKIGNSGFQSDYFTFKIVK